MSQKYIPATEMTKQFAQELNKNFKDHRVAASGGRRYDKLWVRATWYDCSYEILAIIDRTTGALLKARSDGTPQRKHGNRELAPRYDLTDPENFTQAVLDADPYGSFLYLR